VTDVLTSAFDSAGQRCSALRVLCLQEDVADRVLAMLTGALEELRVGNPDRLATDVGPVISPGARDRILGHVEAMRGRCRAVHQCALSPEAMHGTFVAPTIIEIESLSELEGEVFGPVLHVVRVARDQLEAAVEAVNTTGHGLTFGVHSRIDETIGRAIARSTAGNIYVNRNLIGAVVGVQPFGGHGLSGTGPKAGGPLYLRRLMRRRPAAMPLPKGRAPAGACAWGALPEVGREFGESVLAVTPAGVAMDLVGPVGERNEYATIPRGAVVCIAPGREQLLIQVGAALATGNRALIAAGALGGPSPSDDVLEVRDVLEAGCDAVLFAGSRVDMLAIARRLAGREGPIVPIYLADPDGRYPLEFLVRERCVSINTAAAGGNASLMTIG
jgi:RHH-type transcriptional regulator, proline utilization regulon repressor / proline dehydrogenase / delta 1-pyrroline-5-carboxylate dehydrogenase